MTIDKRNIDRAMALIKKGSANADYFFDQLESPDWIEPLETNGLFAEPYAATRRGDMISFPIWVPGQYLARMAAIPVAQERVLKVLRDLPKSDNPRVYEVVADAATAVPPAMAKELVPQLLQAIELSIPLALPGKISAVIVHLAEANFDRAALSLTKALLSIKASPAPTSLSEGEADTRWITREAHGRIDDWQYANVLETILKSLLKSSGPSAFQALCDLLEEAVAAGRKENGAGPDDYSYIWRTSIAHSSSRRENIRDELVSAVRDAADLLAQSTPAIADLVKSLNSRSTRIFHRIALFVLLQYGEHNLPLVETSLSNPSAWGDSGLHPEYELLLARYFDRLSPKVRQSYLDWINHGADQEAYIAFRREMDGKDPTEPELALHKDVWIRDHLSVLAPYLSPADTRRLKRLEEIGPSREVGRPLYQLSVSWQGDHSPLTEEETLSLSWASLIGKLREWTPPASTGIGGPSLEGLAGSVRQRVSANPLEAVEHLSEVVGVRPQYVASILEALREAVKKAKILPWKPLLTFVQRVVGEADAARDYPDQWRWVSRCAASLLNDSFDAGEGSVPFSLRMMAWAIIERLAENPDPSPAYENQFGGTNMDPTTLSINTVRGEAFHAVFRYALWVRRHLESRPAAADYLQRGFDELPEVRVALDRHLDPALDPSLAVRSVYGQWFPWLMLIDSGFAQGRVERIFPEKPEEESLSWAAWGAYVVFCNAYTNVLRVLRPVYERAIAAVGNGNAPKTAPYEHPAEHLADHLMAYYWRGELSLGANDLVAMFFAGADAKLRSHALQWVGRALATLEPPVPPDVEKRLTGLWESRMASAGHASEELKAFGWWFGSGLLEKEWSLKTLEQLLLVSVLPEPDHMVAQRLAALADEYPLQALECLERMVDLAAHGWSINGWLDSARGILQSGLKSGDPEAKTLAVRVIHKFGTLRFRDFRALLQLAPETEA